MPSCNGKESISSNINQIPKTNKVAMRTIAQEFLSITERCVDLRPRQSGISEIMRPIARRRRAVRLNTSRRYSHSKVETSSTLMARGIGGWVPAGVCAGGSEGD